MLIITCPHCGPRDEVEFRYRGDAAPVRPEADATAEAWADHVYNRSNPRGLHLEWWLHVAGCRRALQLLRHTVSHEIAWTGGAEDAPPEPPGAGHAP